MENFEKTVIGLVGNLKIKMNREGEVTVFSLKGKLDIYTREDVIKLIDSVAKSTIKKIIVDLKEIDYLDSAAISALITAVKSVNAAKGGIAFANVSGKIKELLEMTGLSDIFAIYDSVEMAKKALQ